MISSMPLIKTLKKVGMPNVLFSEISGIGMRELKRFFRCTPYSDTGTLFKICRKFNCEIKDVIEYIDEDGNVPEVKGYALSEEDKWDLPHNWRPLLDKIRASEFTAEDIKNQLKVCRTVWYVNMGRIKKGEWIYFSKETVRALLSFTGCELWELTEDVKPRVKKVPLEQTLEKYMDEVGYEYEQKHEKGSYRERGYWNIGY